jgi:uncharacterized repeat protein (TIGR03803 family)
MKTHIINLFLLPALIAVLNLIPAGRVTAQTFTTLHSFTASHTNASGFYTNSDGANPYAGLTAAGNSNVRYGTASNGGSSGWGTVFKVNADGSGFTNLHSFTGSDGANPMAGLILSGHTLYGTTYGGGDWGGGTVFAVNTDGTGFTNLHDFAQPPEVVRCRGDTDCPYGTICITDPTSGIQLCAQTNGAYPNAGLILANNTLYGTTSAGGYWTVGTVFGVNTDGSGFRILHSFDNPFSTVNSDGASPYGGLVLSGNTLYGTARVGGSAGNGTVFAVNTDGTGFTTLHSFTQGIILCLNGSCPPGYHCVGGVCVSCPPGYQFDGWACVPIPGPGAGPGGCQCEGPGAGP